MGWRRSVKKTGDNRTCVGYIRVSTEDQAENGVSIDAQEARIGAYCAAMGWSLSQVIRDAGASAKSLERPGIAEVLGGVRRGSIGRVVIVKLDRLTRSTRDLADVLDLFAKHEAALVSVSEQLDTQSAGGRLVVNMLGVVAQWEREAIGERTAIGLAHKRKNRIVYGHAPFGYRREENRLVPFQSELDALTEARALYDDGVSYRKIAAMLEGRGVKPRGKAWYPASVRAILHSKMAMEALP